MIKRIYVYVALAVAFLGLVKYCSVLRNTIAEKQGEIDRQANTIHIQELEIDSLKESQDALIKSFEEDIAEREKQAKERKVVVKEIVKVASNENKKCLNTTIDDVIIQRLQFKEKH